MSRGRVSLLMCVATIALLWGVVLPALSQTETVKQRHRWLDEKGIDPAAMYYTELEVLDEVQWDSRRIPCTRR